MKMRAQMEERTQVCGVLDVPCGVVLFGVDRCLQVVLIGADECIIEQMAQSQLDDTENQLTLQGVVIVPHPLLWGRFLQLAMMLSHTMPSTHAG